MLTVHDIEGLLSENERLPRKQRYTSGKIYRALRQAGYQGAESTVRAYVKPTAQSGATASDLPAAGL